MKKFKTLKGMVLPILTGMTITGCSIGIFTATDNATNNLNKVNTNIIVDAKEEDEAFFEHEPYIYTPEYQYFLLPTYNLDQVTKEKFMQKVAYSDGANIYTLEWPSLISKDAKESITFEALFINKDLADKIAGECGCKGSDPVVQIKTTNSTTTYTNHLAYYGQSHEIPQLKLSALLSLATKSDNSNTEQQYLSAVLMNPFLYSAKGDTTTFTGHSINQSNFYATSNDVNYESAYKKVTYGIDLSNNNIYTLPVGIFSGLVDNLNICPGHDSTTASDSYDYVINLNDNNLSVAVPQLIFGLKDKNESRLSINDPTAANYEITIAINTDWNNLVGDVAKYQAIQPLYTKPDKWAKNPTSSKIKLTSFSHKNSTTIYANNNSTGFVYKNNLDDFNEMLYQSATLDGKMTNYWPSHIYNDGFKPYDKPFEWFCTNSTHDINKSSYVEFMVYGLSLMSSYNCNVYHNKKDNTTHYNDQYGYLKYNLAWDEYENSSAVSKTATIELKGLNETISGIIWTSVLLGTFAIVLFFTAKKLYRFENPKIAKPKKEKKPKENNQQDNNQI